MHNTRFPEPSRRLDELAHAIVGAAIEVHRHVGPGYLESAYQEALAVELGLRGLAATREASFSVDYKGHSIARGFVDFLVENELVVELKAVEAIAPIHTAQVLAYLKATSLQLALLINFNVPMLRDGVRRIIWHPESEK